MKISTFVLTFSVSLAVFLGGGIAAWSFGAPPSRVVPVATVTVDTGEAWVQKKGVGDLQQISIETPVQSGDMVKTGEKSQAHIDFFHGSTARLDESTEVIIDEVSILSENFASSQVSFRVRAGRVWNRVLKFLEGSNSSYTGNVSNIVATVRGTTFVIDATDSNAWLVQTVEGGVGVRVATNTPVEQIVESGEEAFVSKVASTSPQYLRDSTRVLKRKIAEKIIHSEWFGKNKEADTSFVRTISEYRKKELYERAGMLPGSLFYGLKHLGEKLRTALTSDAKNRDDLKLDYADRRFAEIVTLALGGRVNIAERLMSDYQSSYLVLLAPVIAGSEDTEKNVQICKKVHGRFMEQEMYIRDLGNPDALSFFSVQGNEQNDARVFYRVACEGRAPSMVLPPTSDVPPVTSSSSVKNDTSSTPLVVPGTKIQPSVVTSTPTQAGVTLTKVSIVSRRTMLTHPDTEQTRAYATFSDGSTKEVTNEAVWESANPAVFTVQNGYVTTVSVGTATLRATYQNMVGNFSIRVLPQVSAAITVQSLVVSCSPSTLSLSAVMASSATCSATAKMSDGSTQNVTSATQFSTNSSLGRMSGNVFTTTGQTGTALIVATYVSGTQFTGTAEILIQ